MMTFFKKIGVAVIGIALVVIGTVAMGTAEAWAQPNCSISSATISPNGSQATGWYLDINPPNATITVNANNCTGNVVRVEAWNRNGEIGSLTTQAPAGGTFNTVITHAFTLGDDKCNGSNSPACKVSVKVFVDGVLALNTGLSNVNLSNQLGYFCDTSCDKSAQWGSPSPANWAEPAAPSSADDPLSFDLLENPIAYDSIPAVIRQLITIVFVIGIPLVALAIIYAGFLLVTAGGNQEKIKNGKKALLAAVIGGAILLGAWVIAEAIQGTVDQLRGV